MRVSDLKAALRELGEWGTYPISRPLAGQSLIYGMSGVIGRFAGFFLIPIYLHAAGAKAYGTVDLMLSAVLLASILLRMGIVTTMSRFTLGEGETDWVPIIHTIFVFGVQAAARLSSEVRSAHS